MVVSWCYAWWGFRAARRGDPRSLDRFRIVATIKAVPDETPAAARAKKRNRLV
jgi:hypothetical protein